MTRAHKIRLAAPSDASALRAIAVDTDNQEVVNGR